ncbi:MAG: sulfatase-like hydrolase/transferase [Lachnospiraceae bacterium]
MNKIKGYISRKDKNILITGIWMSAAMNFLFFLYGSLEMFFLNRVDLMFSVGQVLLVIVPCFIGGFILSVLTFGIIWLISDRLCVIFSIVYMILYLVTYIQGTFLVKELPVLTGEAIDWSALYTGRIKSVVALAVVSVVVICAYAFLKREKFYFAVRFICGCMVLMLTVTAVTLYFQTQGVVKEEICATFEGEFEFSSDQNFIILLLDAVNSEVANEIINDEPEYRDMFDGFTYYRNMSGTYPSTSYALSALFSGEWFENKEPYEDFRRRTYEESPLFEYFEKNDYEMGLYTQEVPADKSLVGRFENVLDIQRKVSDFEGAAKCMIKLAGFRYGLFDLKKYFNFNLYNCYIYFTPVGYTPYVMGNEWLYKSMENEDFTVDMTKKFKFIHIDGAHVPWDLDKNVNQIPEDEQGSYRDAVECCFTVAKRFLDKLKETGVYDNSVIVVMADHGYNSGLEPDGQPRHYMPFFCVKGLEEKHELTVSDAPISMMDFIPAFEKLEEGKKSNDIFEYKDGDERIRRFFFYIYGDQEHLQEYTIQGHVFDVSKFQPTGDVYTAE